MVKYLDIIYSCAQNKIFITVIYFYISDEDILKNNVTSNVKLLYWTLIMYGAILNVLYLFQKLQIL